MRFRGHAYIKWDPYLQNTFTVAKLHRLHGRFGHPSTDNLGKFLHRSALDETPGHTCTTLEAISSRCFPCQRFAQAPRRFKFKLKDNFEFNHNIYADVFYIARRPILNIEDEATCYQDATWLKFKSMNATDLRQALNRCWIDVYVGPHDIITHDAGKAFIARSFQSQAELFHIQTDEVPIEASSSMALVERYHQPHR